MRIFYIVAVIVLISLIWAIKVFDDVLPVSNSKFDQTSFVLSAFAFGGITLGFGNIGSYGLFQLTRFRNLRARFGSRDLLCLPSVKSGNSYFWICGS